MARTNMVEEGQGLRECMALTVHSTGHHEATTLAGPVEEERVFLCPTTTTTTTTTKAEFTHFLSHHCGMKLHLEDIVVQSLAFVVGPLLLRGWLALCTTVLLCLRLLPFHFLCCVVCFFSYSLREIKC